MWVTQIACEFVTVAAQIALLPVELNARELEPRKVHTTRGNKLEIIWGGNCGSSSMVLRTVIGTVAGAIRIILL